MKRFVGQVLAMVAVTAICGVSQSFAAAKLDAKTKAANKAHSDAPATTPDAGSPTGNAATGAMATGEGMQGMMSPEMTKWTVSMKACHKGGKTDQACHDRVMKGCEAKLTKGECEKVMTNVNSDNTSKM